MIKVDLLLQSFDKNLFVQLFAFSFAAKNSLSIEYTSQ